MGVTSHYIMGFGYTQWEGIILGMYTHGQGI